MRRGLAGSLPLRKKQASQMQSEGPSWTNETRLPWASKTTVKTSWKLRGVPPPSGTSSQVWANLDTSAVLGEPAPAEKEKPVEVTPTTRYRVPLVWPTAVTPFRLDSNSAALCPLGVRVSVSENVPTPLKITFSLGQVSTTPVQSSVPLSLLWIAPASATGAAATLEVIAIAAARRRRARMWLRDVVHSGVGIRADLSQNRSRHSGVLGYWLRGRTPAAHRDSTTCPNVADGTWSWKGANRMTGGNSPRPPSPRGLRPHHPGSPAQHGPSGRAGQGPRSGARRLRGRGAPARRLRRIRHEPGQPARTGRSRAGSQRGQRRRRARPHPDRPLPGGDAAGGAVRRPHARPGLARRAGVQADHRRPRFGGGAPGARGVICAVRRGNDRPWSGTENMDWIAAVLRRIIVYTQRGGELNIIVTGIN